MDAFVLKSKGGNIDDIRDVLPFIEVKLTITYDKNASSLGSLGNFIIDLNPDCTEVLIVIRYQLKDGEIDALFKDMNESEEMQPTDFFRAIKDRVSKCYTASVYAVDPNDSKTRRLWIGQNSEPCCIVGSLMHSAG